MFEIWLAGINVRNSILRVTSSATQERRGEPLIGTFFETGVSHFKPIRHFQEIAHCGGRIIFHFKCTTCRCSDRSTMYIVLYAV